MNDQTVSQQIKRLGLLPVIYAIKPVLALLNYKGFQELKRVTADLPLAALFQRQPRFLYKYLVPYAAANFDRRTRLGILINHYRYLKARANAAFFPALAATPVLWRKNFGPDECTISLSYPLHVSNEAELSLHFSWNSVLTQVVSFVVVPGSAVGAASPHVMLFGQVQGFANVEQLREITKTLFDITPANLLVHAAYGLASAWGLECAAGVSKQNKVGKWINRYFDYDTFWLDLKGELNPQADAFLLPVPPPERPLEEVKRNHRARTQRKRAFKEAVREEVAQHWQTTFGTPHPQALETAAPRAAAPSHELAMASA